MPVLKNENMIYSEMINRHALRELLRQKGKKPRIGHFRITFSLFLKASLGAHSFTYKLNSFSYAWLCTKTRFEKEAKGNLEMAY